MRSRRLVAFTYLGASGSSGFKEQLFAAGNQHGSNEEEQASN